MSDSTRTAGGRCGAVRCERSELARYKSIPHADSARQGRVRRAASASADTEALQTRRHRDGARLLPQASTRDGEFASIQYDSIEDSFCHRSADRIQAMLETSARLLRLLSLLQARRYWSGKELGERLEIDIRTVRRDVDRLRDLGYTVHASAGVGGGYRFGAGASMPPLLLDDDEAVAMTVALRSIAGGVSRLEDTAMRVLVKLDQILPPRLRPRLSALHAVTVSIAGPADPLDPEVLTSVAVACRDNERLQFRYCDRLGKTTSRNVEPLRLAHTGRRWYLVAWDNGRTDWRTFR